MSFADLSLSEPIVRAVLAEGYTQPTPIQRDAIPHVLAGKDLLGIAQTGTGKTAAFALPVLHRLGGVPAGVRPVRCLVLAPTRELAAQIGESFGTYGKHTGLTNTVIFGGVGQDSQVRALRRGIDVLVATPGRLIDLIDQRLVDLSKVSVLILDEADRMLDMGFVRDVRKIVEKVPTARQTLLFSATMPAEIVSLSKSILKDPVRVEVTPVATTVERIRQHVLFVEKENKRLLLSEILKRPAIKRAIVFTRTKHGADRVVKQLELDGVTAMAIHGNKSQNARERALGSFKAGTTKVLVATDIAARGIDIDEISHVVNYELPNIPESYVHRIGRTARAGADGIALSFCDREETEFLRDIQKLIGMKIEVVENHPYRGTFDANTRTPPAPKQPQQQRGRPGGTSRTGGGGGGRPAGGGGRPAGGGGGGRPGHGGRGSQGPRGH